MSLRHFISVFLLAALFGATSGAAQAFISGSTGSDGALNFTTPGTIDFDPVALGLNPAGDNIFNFTTINIAAGVTVNMRASKLRERSVVFLATGAVTIAGTLALNGATGYPGGSDATLWAPSEPGPGGYPGGAGGTISSQPQAGDGPGAGASGGGFGYYAGYYGNSLLVPLRGGSGGGGGGICCASAYGGSGGAGGGAIQIVSTVSITITGSLTANGGASTGAGGGSGGAIHLEAPVVAGNGSVQAVGGYNNACCGYQGYAGNGWTRVDVTTNNFTGTITPNPAFGPLFNVPLPSAVPTISITSINGIAVPSVPTASFSSPDVTINSAGAVPIALAASNIPVGTILTLLVSSETGVDQTVSATALTGTVANSTATASIVWPLGVSRVYIRAVW